VARALSLADKLALIYTGAGSQRNVAALTGLSHQKVGRILKGEYAPDSKVLSDPGLRAAIDVALDIHTDVARAQARRDKLPFDESLPVFYSRLPMKVSKLEDRIDRRTGEVVRVKVPVIDPATGRQKVAPGDRVAAQNVHFLSDALRNSWIAGKAKTKKFYAASVGSIVDIRIYKKRADAAQRGPRTERQRENRRQIVERVNAGAINVPMFTKYTPLDFPARMIERDITDKLRTKHEPATGGPGTLLANQVLFQIDTRNMEPTSDETRAKPRKTRSPKTRKKPRR
jgi:hypothetical protein